MLRVGLTGGLASGKSTVMQTLAGLGCVTVDADAIVARLYRPGYPGHEALVRTYGPGILLPDGEIDRPRLAALAFSSEEEAGRLNALIHPLVIAEEERLMTNAEESAGDRDVIYVVEATLLLEAGGKERYDRIVVVDVAPETQIQRAIGRGMTAGEARARILHQMGREERLRQADYVIDNNGDEGAALAGTKRVYDALLRDLDQKKKGSGSKPGASSETL
jgi:dephospho-CoA kinase